MMVPFCVGTSPHTRGKPRPGPPWRWYQRNIPAYAGKTEGFHDGLLSMSEHPRIRGENENHGDELVEVLGTSPHTRGKPLRGRHSAPWRRNIPAYAGKTYTDGFGAFWKAEHPRIRGENLISRPWLVMIAGTSPHTRGKPTGRFRQETSRRNIPAYAGKTWGHILPEHQGAEHPRIRGENGL